MKLSYSFIISMAAAEFFVLFELSHGPRTRSRYSLDSDSADPKYLLFFSVVAGDGWI